MNQAEVAAPDGAVGRRTSRVVVRVVPEDRVAVGLGTRLQERGEADAVDEGLERFHAREFEHCRVEVGRDGRRRFDQAGLGDARPADDEGDADSSFVGRTLTHAQRCVIGHAE